MAATGAVQQDEIMRFGAGPDNVKLHMTAMR